MIQLSYTLYGYTAILLHPALLIIMQQCEIDNMYEPGVQLLHTKLLTATFNSMGKPRQAFAPWMTPWQKLCQDPCCCAWIVSPSLSWSSPHSSQNKSFFHEALSSHRGNVELLQQQWKGWTRSCHTRPPAKNHPPMFLWTAPGPQEQHCLSSAGLGDLSLEWILSTRRKD